MNITSCAKFALAGFRLLRANVTRLSSPLKLNLAVTYWCQYRCQTCNIWKKKPENELTTQELLTFIRKNDRFSWADITGGEIFLRPDIGELLEAIACDWKQLAILHFPTNGYQTGRIVRIVERLAPRLAAQLVVTVSLDGYEALNDSIRGVKGGYRHQVETFRALRRIPDVHVVFGYTVSRQNLGALQETFRACRDDCPGLALEDFHVNVMQLSGHYYSNEDSESELPLGEVAQREIREYRKLRGRPRRPAAWLEDVYLRNVDQFLATNESPMRCHALRSTCFVDPWGLIYPCITYSRALGSLRETDMELDPIWRATTTQQVQEEIWRARCPQCWTACEAYPSILGNLVRAPGKSRTSAMGKLVGVVGRRGAT